MKEKVIQAFESKFGSRPSFITEAPGRVNLIGEHTDYNDGFVLPMAIERALWMAVRPRADQQVTVHSLDYGETVTFDLQNLEKEAFGWWSYIKGVAWALLADGFELRGIDVAMAGNVPLGAGLSSSAALELAAARAFTEAAGLPWNAAAMAEVALRAENGWVGLNCGIMDQMISALGQVGHALLIDCRTLAAEQLALPQGSVVVVLDTGTRRGLTESAYNERQAQCTAAASALGINSLRDITTTRFAQLADALPPVLRQRARHVISENERTLQAADAMRAGDAARLGQLMNASHESLRHDYEVSGRALDVMADCARAAVGCYGARMTGAGFAGCAVALVDERQVAAFTAQVAAAYEAEMGQKGVLYVSRPSRGASCTLLKPATLLR